MRRNNPYRTAALLMMLMAAAVPAKAQNAVASSQESAAADRRLRDIEEQLRKSRFEQEETRRKAKALTDEATEVRNDMVAAARAAQESEELLSELEWQLADLNRAEIDKTEALSRRSQQMTSVLTALQRLAWRPTEALIAQPQSPADMVRSAILLRAAVPQIEKSAETLRGEIDMLGHLRGDIVAQKKRIATTTAKLAEEHARLKDLWMRKASLQSAAQAANAEAEQRVAQQAGEAQDLRELLQKLEEDRQRRIVEAQEKAAAEKAAREAEAEARHQARLAEQAARQAEREAAIAQKRAEKEQHEREQAEAREAREVERRAQAEAKEKELAAQKALQKAELAAREAAVARPLSEDLSFGAPHGQMPYPARGRVTTKFGQSDSVGTISKGINISTRAGAQVIATQQGQVAFAGPFRGYGLLLIIEHAEGYHTLLAGMARIDVLVGQRLQMGEPVGVMDPNDGNTSLYVELRHNGQPINPMPWLSTSKSKVRG